MQNEKEGWSSQAKTLQKNLPSKSENKKDRRAWPATLSTVYKGVCFKRSMLRSYTNKYLLVPMFLIVIKFRSGYYN